MQFSNYDHTDHTHMCDILQIRDKQQLEILVLLKYHVLHITVQRHTTIVTNETFVNSTVGSYMRSNDRAVNANGDQVSDYSAHGHFRHELCRGGSAISTHFMPGGSIV